MVVKIKTGKNVRGALNYNEHKVEDRTAECIGANGFLKETSELNFYEKLAVLMNRNERNTRTSTNTIHISLNFDPSEKLKKDDLNSIASDYMDKIGFSDQPYLIYEHRDAAHPHLHIVSTLIKSDGSRIPTHYLGKNESEKARKEVEREFGLVIAQGKAIKIDEKLFPVAPEKAAYGTIESKKSIAQIVSNVTRNYRYTSLAELNAVLRLYNVNASRGGEKSQMFLKGGLHYSLVSDGGERVGVPIKASALPGKPTLNFLNKQFERNQILRQSFKDPLKRIIDATISVTAIKTSNDFVQALNSQNVRAVWRINPQGRIYGVTFVDQDRKVVFNGSDLGKAYAANTLLERLSIKENSVQEVRHSKRDTVDQVNLSTLKSPQTEERHESSSTLTEVLHHLTHANNKNYISPENAMKLRRKKKRKKYRS